VPSKRELFKVTPEPLPLVPVRTTTTNLVAEAVPVATAIVVLLAVGVTDA
jgi:hypothetical protein